MQCSVCNKCKGVLQGWASPAHLSSSCNKQQHGLVAPADPHLTQQYFLYCRLLHRSKFYDRLKELREYHKRFPVYDISSAEDDSGLLKEEPRVEFSGEEGMGRWVLDIRCCCVMYGFIVCWGMPV